MARGRWMGVPLLHPWANRLADWDYEALGQRVDLRPLAVEVVIRDRKTGLPIHGVLPRPWEVRRPRTRGRSSPSSRRPATRRSRSRTACALEAEISPEALRIATTLEALEGEVPVAFGFHPWFSPPGAVRADYAVELPAMRRLELDDRHLPTGARRRRTRSRARCPSASSTTPSTRSPTARCSRSTGGGRRVAMRFDAGYPCAQVFAPTDKDLICFEPMTAPARRAAHRRASPSRRPGGRIARSSRSRVDRS